MNIKQFDYICRLSQKNLKKYVTKELRNTHEDIIANDGYVFARGDFPVLLVAHLDTVHSSVPQKIYLDTNKNAIHSPQGIGGDDRCGVYMILDIVKRYNCSVLFCEDEETGGRGATQFCKDYRGVDFDFKYIVELDRRGNNDAVFYDCANDDFEDFICDGYFKHSWGTFSDISIIAPTLEIAAVNLSCGYYNPHTTNEYVVTTDVDNIIVELCKILDKTDCADRFEYVEAHDWSAYRRYDDRGEYWYDDEDEYYCIEFKDEKDITRYEVLTATSMTNALGKFMQTYQKVCYADIVDITTWVS